MKQPEALRHYDEGLALYRKGDVAEALSFCRRVIELEPDSFVVRKQVWAVEHPERFFAGPMATAWQREQIGREH